MSAPDDTALLDAISHYLADECGLARLALDRSKALPTSAESPRFFLLAADVAHPLSLRVDDHHDISLHGLVVDLTLGSIGLIHVLAPAPKSADLRRLVEEAAYVRHLLGLKRADQAEPMSHFVPAVELVFVSDSTPALLAVGETLRESLKKSAQLHTLSVGLAALPANNITSADLRRAFCWLLPATRRWFGQLDTDRKKFPGAAPTTWDEVTAQDFRRAGRRVWTKKSASRIHLLHGPNGSGKSTLAEAFVFAATGDSPRLPPASEQASPAERFAPLICQSPPNLSASCSIRRNNSDVIRREVPGRASASPESPPPAAAGIPPGALLLDQRLCDRLATQGPVERAQTWLRTFFSDLETTRSDQHQTSLSAAEKLRILAPDLPDDDRTSLIQSARKKAAALLQPNPPPFTLFDFLHPLVSPGDREGTLASLNHAGLACASVLQTSLSPAPGEPLKLLTDTLRADLGKQLGAALREDAPRVEAWRTVDFDSLEQLLGRLDRDTYGSRPGLPAGLGPQERAQRVNRWLHLVARADLLERARVIALTRETLTAVGETDPLFDEIAGSLSAERLQALLTEARSERDSLRRELSSLAALTESAAIRASTDQVTVNELGPLLKAVEAGLFGEILGPTEVDALIDLVRRRQGGAVGRLRVGESGWTQPLLQRCLTVRHALLTLTGPLLAPIAARSRQPGARAESRADTALGLVTDILKLAQLDAGEAALFFEQLREGPFRDAIDEFTALLTPARWAYTPIETVLPDSQHVSPGTERLEIRSHGLDVGAVLNTAELNTIALALYLLCSPRVANPWRVVFLDDPLQNMDELTVATVARALSRLLRLWRSLDHLRDWELVILLHGEEDCERFLLEIPAAHYRIPWLSPAATAGTNALPTSEYIPAVDRPSGDHFISLDGFFAHTPA